MNEFVSRAIIQRQGRPSSQGASPDGDQENAWVSASRRGDTGAFNRLVLKWEKTIFNIALRMLRDRDEAAEATQEIFLMAYQGIRRFRHDSRFSTWLYRIAVNNCLTRVKQRPPGIRISLETDGQAVSPAPQLRVAENQSGHVMQQEQRYRVIAAMSHLPPEQHVVIELKFFQERTFEEIAAILDVPLSTIKSRLYAGLEMLKTRLGSEA